MAKPKQDRVYAIIIGALAAVLLWFLLGPPAFSQVIKPWNTITVTLGALPTTCADGAPITQCPVTGYRIERQLGSGAFAPIKTLGIGELSFDDKNLLAGKYTYRAVALCPTCAAPFESAPSPISPGSTKTIAPAVPSPPGGVLLTVDTQVRNVVPDWPTLSFRSSVTLGTIALQKPCQVAATSDGWNRVERKYVKWLGTSTTSVPVARCSMTHI